jgi:hypothetical protein
MHRRTVAEERIVAMLRLGGFAYVADVDAAEALVREALSSWVERGLGVRTMADGQRRYDPVEVTNFFKTEGVLERDDFWSQRWVATGRRLVDDLRQLPGPARFTVECRRCFALPPSGARLRASLPLPGEDLRDLDIDIALASAGEVRVSPGRLEARIAGSIAGEVVLMSRSSFVTTPFRHSEPLSSAARAIYLRPREGLIAISETVAALARRLAGPGTKPRQAIASFWGFLMDELICGAIPYDQIDADAPCDWALATGTVDCQLASSLLIALCRAIGVPGRLVGGYMLYRLAPTKHYWAEIWLDETGWAPFDFQCWDLSCGGRDASWRDRFFGQLDARMTTERLPLAFTGAIGVPMPAAWHILLSGTPGGAAIELVDLAGQTIYRDLISVIGPDQAGVTRAGTAGCVARSASNSRSSIAEPSSR